MQSRTAHDDGQNESFGPAGKQAEVKPGVESAPEARDTVEDDSSRRRPSDSGYVPRDPLAQRILQRREK